MSNYPKELWRTQLHNKLPIASSFDITKEKYVRKGMIVRLGSLYGVKVVDIGDRNIVVRQVPLLKISNKMIRFMGKWVQIELGERKTVGDYSVKLLELNKKQARISISYVFKAWENEMKKYIQSNEGHITVKDMMNWSRLHSRDLDGLRPMCEDLFTYESAMIYKIPKENYEILSIGWFSPNHACSSIYVPVHIADTDIYCPYKTGEAAALSLELLKTYGHNSLTPAFSNVEDVFLNETDLYENYIDEITENQSEIANFLTFVDMSMQKQAWLTQQIWIEIDKMPINEKRDDVEELVTDMWKTNYSISLNRMEKVLYALQNISAAKDISNKIIDISLVISKSEIDAARAIGRNVTLSYQEYYAGRNSLEEHNYASGFNHLQQTLILSNSISKDRILQSSIGNMKIASEDMSPDYLLVVFLVLITGMILTKNKRNN